MKIRIVYEHWYPKLFKIEAITLYPFILCQGTKEETTRTTLRHEMIHVEQIKRLGWLGFYWLYLRHMVEGIVQYRNFWTAYRMNALEREAYGRQGEPFTTEEVSALGANLPSDQV
jgi:hypothetical protein